MKTFLIEPAYEPLRSWALHPTSIRPSGVAHLLRGGMLTWVREAQSLLASEARAAQSKETHMAAPVCFTPLSTMVAAMIAEVCR